MNKEKIVYFIENHYNIFKRVLFIFSYLNLKNKICSKGLMLKQGVSFINGLVIHNKGHKNEIYVGDYSRIKSCRISIRGSNNKIFIDEFVMLDNVEICMEDDNNSVRIGKNTYIYGKTELSVMEGTNIKIGNNCLFSSCIHFRTGDSHSILDCDGNRLNKSEDIVIENHVWIGTKVTCLKGVHVSSNSVVAATTTLCKKYNKSNVIIAGIPGKITKTDINWCSERK